MPGQRQTDKAPETKPFSDEAVRARTGRTWDEWFAVLDAAGSARLPHKRIASYLVEQHQVDGWWAQSVTVGYERARGLRQVHQTPRGFEVSASRTFTAPVERLFAAWDEQAQRTAWLEGDGYTLRKSTQNKGLRITWSDGTSVDVRLTSKAGDRSYVAIQHTKLPDADAVPRFRAFWKAQLDRLSTVLQG